MSDEYSALPKSLAGRRQQFARIAEDAGPAHTSRNTLKDLEYLHRAAERKTTVKTGAEPYGDGIKAKDALELVAAAETELDEEAARVLHSKEGYLLGLQYGFGASGMAVVKEMLRERVNEKTYENIFDAPATAISERRKESRKTAFA